MGVNVVPATPAHVEQVEAILSRTECWCAYYRQSSTEYGRGRSEESSGAIARRRQLLLELLDGEPAPGLLALDGTRAIGWCGVGMRSGMQRLVRSRTIPKIDDRDVLSVVCFLTGAGMRRKGVATALLDGVVRYATQLGTPAEGYPIAASGFVNSADAHVGTVSMFEGAGFHRVCETSSKAAGLSRWVMRFEPS